MFSASGARNIKSRVRIGIPKKKQPGRAHLSERKLILDLAHYGNHLSSEVKLSPSPRKHHSKVKMLNEEGSSDAESHVPQPSRRSKSRSERRRESSSTKIQDKLRKKIKETSKRGIGVMKQSKKVAQRSLCLTPNTCLSLKSSKPRPLPAFTTLFRYQPRNWFGFKKGSKRIVDEDWRNVRTGLR